MQDLGRRITCVEPRHLDDIVQPEAELAEHLGNIRHAGTRLRDEVARIDDRAFRIDRHLPANVDHVPMLDAVLVGKVHRPVPMPVRPRVLAQPRVAILTQQGRHFDGDHQSVAKERRDGNAGRRGPWFRKVTRDRQRRSLPFCGRAASDVVPVDLDDVIVTGPEIIEQRANALRNQTALGDEITGLDDAIGIECRLSGRRTACGRIVRRD